MFKKLMKFAILASEKDAAAMNIALELEKANIKIICLKTDSIYSENIDKQIFADLFIFVSKHKSEQKNKTLTIHAPGNWGQADFGGSPNKVCPTASFFLKHLFLILTEKARGSDYKVSLECTHHGPYLEKPCCFVEIGSSEEEWCDKNAAIIVAQAVKEAITTDINPNWISCIGIGGPHYCPNFNKVQASKKYALGHIIPEYALPLTKEMLKEAIEKTLPQPEFAVLDWKGLPGKKERENILALIEQTKLKCIKTEKAKDE